MSNRRSKPEILAELAEDFVVRFRRGERPSVNEYVQQHPDLSEDIQKVIKTLLTIEQRAANGASGSAAPDDNSNGDHPRQIGDFRIVRQVGRGGMGIVYEAEQMSLGRRVALKVLPQQMLLDERQRKRFEREARAVAKLHHTNIVPVFGVGEFDGLHYYVMQFIQGLGLNEVLKEVQQNCQQRPGEGSATLAPLRVSRRDLVSSDTSHPSVSIRDPQGGQGTRSGVFFELPRQEDVTIDGVSGEVAQSGSQSSSSTPAGALSDTFTLSDPSGTWPDVSDGDSIPRNQPADYWHSVANIGYQVASALHYAHEQGVFHRDVKPSNLLLDTHGTVWVLDFGLAKASDQHDLTHSGDLLGTLRYMSPEALDGKTDARSDIYSLGLTLYELLALQPAFNETVSNKLIKQVSDHEPTRLDKFGAKIPRDLVTVVHKAIDRDPNRRYQSSRELAEDLNHFLNDEPIRARRTSTVEHVWRWSRRNRGLAAAVAMIAILLLTINIAGPILTLRLKNAYDAEVTARSHARQAQNEALDSLDLAEQREQDLNHTLYRAEMNLAGQAAEERAGIERIWDLTEAWRPDETGVDLRDWEWFYLHGLGRLAQQTIRVDGGNAEAIAWSPDGSLLVFGQDDGTLVVWNPRTEKTVLRKNLHKAHVLHVCWSPDGTKVASIASQDKLVRVWDPLTGNELQSFPLPGENDWSSSVSFSRDSRLLAADSRNEITIWDLQLDRQLRTLTMPEVSQVAWSPVDHRIAALSKTHRIIIWDGSTGEQLAKYEHGSGCFAWDPHGEHLAYAGQDRRMHILDLSNGKTVHSPVGHVAEIATLAWNTAGTRLASAGKDTTVRIWDPKTGDEVARLRGHAGFVTSLAWMPDRPLLATSARDRTLKIWNTDSTEERLLLKGHRAPVESLSWGPDGRYLAMSSGTWTAVWDVDGKAEIREQLGQRSSLSPNGKRLAIASGAKIAIRDTRSGELFSTLSGHTEGITRLAWNSEGTRLASASWDGTARIWNPVTEESLTTIELSHRDRGICWSPEGLRLATIGNRDVQIWDAESGTQLLQYSGLDQIHAIAWSPDGELVASGGWGREISIWDANTAEPVLTLPGHTSPITSLCWNPSGTRLVSGSEDQIVRVWDLASKGELLSLRAHPVGVTNVTWSPDGLRIASGDQNGQVVVWDATTGHLVERTPQAITILDRRIEINPTIDDLALRAEILQSTEQTEAALKDRQRVRLIREEQLDEILEDQLAVDALASELLAEIQMQNAARWSTLPPLRMKANDGATLALQPDRSIYVTGSNTAGVVYEIVAVVDTPVTGLRLETIPDSRLPHGGSGRATDNGNFHVAELEVVELKSASLESDVVAQIAINKHFEDTQGNPAGRSIAKVIDDNRRTLWDTYPNHTSPHWAIFEFAQPLESETGRAVIRIRVDSGISQWGPHGLGRFRLSVTDDARVVECEQQLTSLVSKPSNDIAFLGGAYAMLGETDKASAAFAAAIEQSQDHLARQALISTAARFDGLVSHLSSRLPAEPWLMLARADQCAKRGELEHSIHLRGKAITHLLELGAEEPEVLLQALEEVAVAYVDDGCIDESLQVLRPAYERSREILCPKHPQTINLLGRLADVSEQVREYDQARELRLDEFTLREQMHGLEDPQTLSAGGRLADVYAKCGQISEAIALRVRIAETVPVEDLNASQQTAFFLIWQGDVDRYAVLCRKLLEAADGTEVIKTARDSAKAVLIHPQSDPELVDAAAVLADQAAKRSPTNLWSVLTLGMSHYRQGRLDEAAEYLERAAAAPEVRLSLLARVFLAMTKFRQGDIQKAREQLGEAEQRLGLVAVIDLQSPFVLHHDDLAVWLVLREARRLIEIKLDATPDAKDRLLAFQHRAVEKFATDTERSLHLAVLYAWYGDHAAHRDLCRQLIAAARNSQLPRDLERAAKAYLVCPDPEPGLLASAAKCAEEAVGLWEHDHELRPWAQMAAGMAAYRQQRYAEAIQLLSDAQQVPNRLIKGPALFFRSMTHLRQGHREQARSDFGTAVDLMKPPPDRTASTEAVLEHNELVMWLAYDEANRLFAADGLPFLADD